MPLATAERTYKYEVAISFLQQDESLAHAISDTIQDRYSVFLYSERQKELVGKDGSETFRKVFEEEARIVVVLFREEWGTTFWTRIEEDAIKRRAFEESADFTIFISLDKNKPDWLSKFQIWYDFERFGIKPTAAIIEKRIAEYGGHTREETVLDQAARQKRKYQHQQEVENYLLSQEAIQDAAQEVLSLLHLAESNIAAIHEMKTGINYGIAKNSGFYLTTFGLKIGLTFNWFRQYSNTLSGSYLEAFIATGDYYHSNPRRIGQKIDDKMYAFFLNEGKTKGWVELPNKNNFLTSEQLVSKWQKRFLARDHKDRDEESKKRSRY